MTLLPELLDLHIFNEGDPDEGGRWMLICREHGELIQLETRADARYEQRHSEDWCEGCQARHYGPQPEFGAAR